MSTPQRRYCSTTANGTEVRWSITRRGFWWVWEYTLTHTSSDFLEFRGRALTRHLAAVQVDALSTKLKVPMPPPHLKDTPPAAPWPPPQGNESC